VSLGEYFLLAFISIFWPLLIAVVVVALRQQHPVRLLSAFLAGGLLATITIGIAIVFALEGTSFVSGSRPHADPAVNIVIGVVALVAAYVLHGLDRPVDHSASESRRRRTEHYLGNARLAFLAGLILDIAPGVFPFVALRNIAEGSYPDSTKVLLVVVFYVIMFAFVELPIAGYVIAPGRTEVTVQRFNRWLSLNGRNLATSALAVGGLYLIVRGLTQL
jgi:hypothetical protein